VALDFRLEPDVSRSWPLKVLVSFAIAKYLQKDFKKAEDLCKRVLAEDSNFWQAHLYLGLSLFKQNRMSEAELAFRATIGLNPKCSAAHQYLRIM